MNPKIERALIVTVAIIAVIVTGIIIWGTAEYRGYTRAKAEADVLTAQYEAKAKQADLAILTLQREAVILRTEKKRALENAALHEADAASKQIEIDRLKAETAALAPDALTGKLADYIGATNISYRAGGLYICTRAGAEATLNRFLDGDSYKSQYESEKAANLNLRAAIDAAERAAANSDQQRRFILSKYDAALLAWSADQLALKRLERSIFGRRTKSFITGAAIGAASVLIYQLAKGK